MNTKCKIALGVVAGAVLGAAAMQGLHAQMKPKAYFITESELIDAAALATYVPQIRALQKAGGGRSLASGTKIVAFAGEPPKRFSVSEWESLEKAQAWGNSDARKALMPQRDKAIKIIRQFAIEAPAN